MNKIKFTIQKFAVGCFTLALTALAASAAPRAFVSTDGNDANSCGRNQPCRTFTAALAAVDAGGEIVVLDSGGYGAVTINKAVQIVAPDGVHASIASTSGNAITVAAGASDTIVLRGLTLNGNNNFGINFDSGAALYVENCVINNFFRGVLFDAAGKLFVKNTTLRNNFVGILVDSSSGNVQAAIADTTVENGSVGFSMGNNTKAVINRAAASNNTVNGFSVSGNGILTISQSTAAHNGQNGFVSQGGISAILNADYCTATPTTELPDFSAGGGANVIVRVSNSTATDNAVGFDKQNVSIFESFGNNRVRGNTTNVSGAITTVSEL